MIRWPFRRHRVGDPDQEAFFAELAASHPGKGYKNSMGRYRDFRRVFLDSEQGKRVLYEIMLWSHIGHASASKANFNPYETMFLDGERSIGIKIMVTMNAEPKARPTSTKEKK